LGLSESLFSVASEAYAVNLAIRVFPSTA